MLILAFQAPVKSRVSERKNGKEMIVYYRPSKCGSIVPHLKYVFETPQNQTHRFHAAACLDDIRTETHLQFRQSKKLKW